MKWPSFGEFVGGIAKLVLLVKWHCVVAPLGFLLGDFEDLLRKWKVMKTTFNGWLDVRRKIKKQKILLRVSHRTSSVPHLL